ncbi:hypothetical protein FDH96_gp080 [Mycobacterium phage Rey]|uniref:Uncharacterized protein n=1 Tax=Mycobacterium phage Rey TaxID=1034115 RepID=G1D5E2_9CAUD|nr:hypothetical protein FDH96_gp080 [Mycobacterium phage Rey]AEK10064.1 hypothetical protein PBI_REY_80 [Mycobacterium phage Rey]
MLGTMEVTEVEPRSFGTPVDESVTPSEAPAYGGSSYSETPILFCRRRRLWRSAWL